jgi:hypothetical protein
MSNSLQIAEHPPATSKDSSQNPKMMMITALMTMITTIAVSFIGVVPSLRRRDAQELDVLRQKVVNQEPAPNPANNSSSTDKKVTIQGTVTSKDGRQTLNGYDVYFLPEGNSQQTTSTDDSGKFYKEMPPGTYSIIVRDSAKGASGKGILDEDYDKVGVQGATIHYRIKRR